MKLQQLRYFLEVYRCNLNISEAAEILFTSQPGISKQIKLLEDELGVQLLYGTGKRIVAVTPPGQAVLEIAERIFRDVQSIRNIGTEFAEQDSGHLTIATTYTQARHVLPPVVAEFFRQYPKVGLSLVPAEPSAVDRMVAEGLADFAINSEADARHPSCATSRRGLGTAACWCRRGTNWRIKTASAWQTYRPCRSSATPRPGRIRLCSRPFPVASWLYRRWCFPVWMQA